MNEQDTSPIVLIDDDREIARATPGGLACYAGIRGRPWKLYRHLDLMNRIALALAACDIMKVIVILPPQEGKSSFWSVATPAWWLGTFPEQNIMLGGYESEFASGFGRAVCDILKAVGPDLWGLKIRQDQDSASNFALEWMQPEDPMRRYPGGGMMTAGRGGGFTGKSADLIVIDDPIKNAQEAMSKKVKEEIWDWWEGTIVQRIRNRTRVVIPCTRWAEDDLIGRILKNDPKSWLVIRMPAIAEEDETWSFDGEVIFTRNKGEALCPDIHSLEFLNKLNPYAIPRGTHSKYWWDTNYQGKPSAQMGNIFDIDRIKFCEPHQVPDFERVCRAWDFAASLSGKRSAGVKIARGADKMTYILDARFDWWEVEERDKAILRTANEDGPNVRIRGEQEPGSGGKAQIHYLGKMLAGYSFEIAPAVVNKILRAEPFAAQVNLGNVVLVRGPWNTELLDEMKYFPNGPTIDIIDAAAHGFNDVTLGEDACVVQMMPGQKKFSAGNVRSRDIPVVQSGETRDIKSRIRLGLRRPGRLE